MSDHFLHNLQQGLFSYCAITTQCKREGKMKKFYLPASLLLGYCLTTSAGATSVTFSDFSNTSTLTLNGSAAAVSTTDGSVLRLTSAAVGQSGSAFNTATIQTSTFSTYFSFRITNPGGTLFDGNTETGADGLVFVVQNVSASIGGSGQGIGYAGIGHSVGVEFLIPGTIVPITTPTRIISPSTPMAMLTTAWAHQILCLLANDLMMEISGMHGLTITEPPLKYVPIKPGSAPLPQCSLKHWIYRTS